MILELKIKNFLSFKEEATFSFEATKDKSFEDYQVVEVAPNARILRLALVYGANASGKSNLINAFEFIRFFWLNNPDNKDKSTEVVPFLLDQTTPNEPSEFSLIFYIGRTKYMYSLKLDKKTVLSENLSMYQGTRPSLIFTRKLHNGVSEITFNSKRIKISQTAKDEITIRCLTNMSVLAAYNQVNVAFPEMENVIKWIKTQYYVPYNESNTVGLIKYVEEIITKDNPSKDLILNFLQQADFNITNVNTGIIENDKTETEFEHRIINKEGKEEFFRLLKKNQSKGTLRTFGLAGAICKTIEANAFLAIDEIESSLHSLLVEFIIEYFFKRKGQSQLLLTTHYDGLLEEDDLFRKDSIWFTYKNKNGSTELYSLADFRGINRIASLQKAYKYGKFGAVPNIL